LSPPLSQTLSSFIVLFTAPRVVHFARRAEAPWPTAKSLFVPIRAYLCASVVVVPSPSEPHEVLHEALLLYIINFLSIFQIPPLKTPFPSNKINGFTRQNSLLYNKTKGSHDLTRLAGYSPSSSSSSSSCSSAVPRARDSNLTFLTHLTSPRQILSLTFLIYRRPCAATPSLFKNGPKQKLTAYEQK